MPRNNGNNPLNVLFEALGINVNGKKPRHVIDVAQVKRLLHYADIPMEDIIARINEGVTNTERELNDMLASAQADHTEVMSTYDAKANEIRAEYERAVAQAEYDRDEQMADLDNQRFDAERSLERAQKLMKALANSKQDMNDIMTALGETLEEPKDDAEDSTDELEPELDAKLDMSDLEPQSSTR